MNNIKETIKYIEKSIDDNELCDGITVYKLINGRKILFLDIETKRNFYHTKYFIIKDTMSKLFNEKIYYKQQLDIDNILFTSIITGDIYLCSIFTSQTTSSIMKSRMNSIIENIFC